MLTNAKLYAKGPYFVPNYYQYPYTYFSANTWKQGINPSILQINQDNPHHKERLTIRNQVQCSR